MASISCGRCGRRRRIDNCRRCPNLPPTHHFDSGGSTIPQRGSPPQLNSRAPPESLLQCAAEQATQRARASVPSGMTGNDEQRQLPRGVFHQHDQLDFVGQPRKPLHLGLFLRHHRDQPPAPLLPCGEAAVSGKICRRPTPPSSQRSPSPSVSSPRQSSGPSPRG